MDKYEGDISKLVDLGKQIGGSEARARQLAAIVLCQRQSLLVPDHLIVEAISPYLAGALPSALPEQPRRMMLTDESVIDAVLAQVPAQPRPVPASLLIPPDIEDIEDEEEDDSEADRRLGRQIQIALYALIFLALVIWREPIWSWIDRPIQFIQHLAQPPKRTPDPQPSSQPSVAPSPTPSPADPAPTPSGIPDLNQRIKSLQEPVAPL